VGFTVASVSVSNSAPLVIGATGGSGTRVVARIAKLAGYNLGTHLNSAEDALEFYSFHDNWINPFVSAARSGQPLSPWRVARMKEDFHAALARHIPKPERRGIKWGWKTPRSIYLLPFLHTEFDQLKFIHLVRDGRDMALSRNQNQLKKHGKAVLSLGERLFRSLPERAALLWSKVNVCAADYGETRLGLQYLRVRFEDLCLKPLETTVHILNFIGESIDPEPIVRSEIVPPKTLGRWRSGPGKIISHVEKMVEPALRRFGYSD
jgi:hypothetical protein